MKGFCEERGEKIYGSSHENEPNTQPDLAVYRSRHENRVIAALSCMCAVLLGGLGLILSGKMSPGLFMVQQNYGAVLLRGSQKPYFVIALLAFLAGVTFTLICIKINQKTRRLREEETKECERQNASNRATQ